MFLFVCLFVFFFASFFKVPDVYFRDAQKLLIRIVTNIVSEPDNPKLRSINMTGKAFQSIAQVGGCESFVKRLCSSSPSFPSFPSSCQAPGAVDVLLFLGFKMQGDHLALPEQASIDPESLDYLLRIEDIREREKVERAEREESAKKAAKEAKNKALLDKIASDRVEAAQKTVTASKSKLVPFAGRDAGLKDVGGCLICFCFHVCFDLGLCSGRRGQGRLMLSGLAKRPQRACVELFFGSLA